MFLGEAVAHGGIESHAERTEERAPVYGAVVAGQYVVGGYDSCGQLHIDRDADMAREAVARAGGQDAESRGCADETGGDFVDSAVAAAGNDSRTACGGCFGGELTGMPGIAGLGYVDGYTYAAESAADLLRHFLLGAAARYGIDNQQIPVVAFHS